MNDTKTDSSALTVGWIGTGRMGAAMAARLARAGVDLTAWNRTRAKAEPLAELGCAIADSIADLRDRDVVFTMVSTPADLEQVLIGDGGLLADPEHVPAAVVDCSTVSTESSEAMREACRQRGVAFLAAPVSGNGKVVAAGGLTLVVSGPEETYQRVAPLLRHIGKSVTYVGDGDTARLVKICHNLFLGVVTQSLAEITVLAERGGVPRAAFLEFLNNSVMGSVFTRYKSPAFVQPGLHPDVHADPAAQGLRPRARRRPAARRAHAGRRDHRTAGAGEREQRPGHRGLRDPARPAGGQRPAWSSSPRTSRWTTASAEANPTHEPADGSAARPGPHGRRLRAARRLRPAPRYRLAGPRHRWSPASAARSCSSTSTTSATPRRPGSAARSATR